MNTKQAQEGLRPLIDRIKQETFSPEYRDKVTDEIALGVLISKFFEWDGVAVLRVAERGLEDCNFHKVGEKVKILADSIELGIE